MRGLAGAIVVVLAVALPVPVTGGPGASVAGAPVRRASACDHGPMPFAGIAGAHLTAEEHVTEDARPMRYVRWRGFAPSFDGMPLSVDVTLPCNPDGPLPTVVLPHGFTDDKTVWEETGKSDSIDSKDRPGPNSHWNTIWFASRGYASLTYTARGWHDSCGPDTPGHTSAHPAPRCAPYEWWIHLDDQRWEVRDLQFLTAGLVQSHVADPDRLAVTGGSYGGAPAATAALLADRVVCGGAAQPGNLGPDPCAGKGAGDRGRWTTPDGRTPLTWAAALPLYTFGDLLQVLAPNGRGSDGWSEAPRNGAHAIPVGVPLESTLSGLLLAAQAFGSLAPPGRDPDSDILTSANRLLAGNPFPLDDPIVHDGIGDYAAYKSPMNVTPRGHVPIFWVQGLTDALFPGSEATQLRNAVLAGDPAYPFKLFLGDLGHDYAAERTDEWKHVHVAMNAFLDHALRPDRTPTEPTYDVSAAITRCLDHDAPMRILTARTWDALHPGTKVFTGNGSHTTSTERQGPHGLATDPISTATLPGPDSYKGCRIVDDSDIDPTVATYDFALDQELTILGGPVVDLTYGATGTETPLAVRVWDVDPKANRQGLVTRGVYRSDQGPGDRLDARFQLAPQGYRFPRGHLLRVEVTGNDTPYLQASSIRSDITVRRLRIALPVAPRHRATTARPGTAPTGDGGGGHGTYLRRRHTWMAFAGVGAAMVALGLLSTQRAAWRRRRTRP